MALRFSLRRFTDQGVYLWIQHLNVDGIFHIMGIDDGEDKLSDISTKPKFKLGQSNTLISWNSPRKGQSMMSYLQKLIVLMRIN